MCRCSLRCVAYSCIHPDQVTTTRYRCRSLRLQVRSLLPEYTEALPHHLLHSFSGFMLHFFPLFCAFYAWQITSFVLSIMRLMDMYISFKYPICTFHLYHAVYVPMLFFRKISRLSLGLKSSDASEPFVTLIHSQNSCCLHVHA